MFKFSNYSKPEVSKNSFKLFVTYDINYLFIFSLLLIKKTTDKFPRPCEVDLLFPASD